MNSKKNKRAIVVNGRKGVSHRVFFIRGAYVELDWDTDEYLRTPKHVIDAQMAHTRSTGSTSVGYWDGGLHFK